MPLRSYARRVRPPLYIACLLSGLIGYGACRRALEVPEPTYREAVTAFYTALAAMQTSQELMARREFARVTELVPGEPAAWANLGLLLMRQQELDEAAAKLAKAAELAPDSAAIERLLALLESRNGRLPEAIRHWKRAIELDPGDLKAPYALSLDTERQGGEGAAEAQRVLESLVARSGNLAARLEVARLAAKRSDANALQQAVAGLAEKSTDWPPPAREQLRALQEAAAGRGEAATRVAFLKNVLLRTPEYRHALAAVSTPRAEVGEPLARFLALRNLEPRPAPPDVGLSFASADLDAAPAARVTAAWLDGAGAPMVVAVDGGGQPRLAGASAAAFPSGTSAGAPGPFGLVAADFNYDHRTDVLLAGAGGLKLLRHDEEGGRFSDVTAATALPPAVLTEPAFGAWAADVDTDGDLDAVLAVADGPARLLRNNGDGTFAAQPAFGGLARVRDFAWADADGDGVPDAALLDASGVARVFLNLRGGVFREEPALAGAPKLVALATAELSGDALLDFLGVAADGSVYWISLAEDRRRWDVAAVARLADPPAGMTPGSARLLVADLDNNGAHDLVVSGPTASRVLLGAGPKAFSALPAPLPLGAQAVADLDGDGRVEIVGVGEAGHAMRAASRGTKAYRWQALRPRSATATGDQRINSFGIGGEVELRTGLHLQKRAIDAPVVHFGLGEAERAEVVRIVWPNGMIQSDFNLAADTTVAATQRLKGSCPWLFAWNGHEMAFVTDLIWRSPLGLRINAQSSADVAMTEDRVKLRGDQLAPRAGGYDLRITAELWETHYFDLMELLVVDHPQGTVVFVDERFAVPPPRLDVVVTDQPRELRAARDDRGRDVSDVVGARDDRHLDFAGRGAYQGVTRDHYVELELPEHAPRSEPLWLVAQGWVHPTDSSINVALSQGSHPPPRGLSLQVADAAGRFRTIRTGLGFPSGKDKTVLIDLAGVFPPTGQRRLRLETNLEIFWDRLAWAVGRPDVRVAPRRIALTSAELRERGYSVTEQKDPSSPERPRYILAGTAARWLDLEGYHTRFGDVQELLVDVDDRYAILTAGDELRLRFQEASGPAPGLVRDFVLVGDGWNKDGDFNTSFSRTVLPLPSHARARYDAVPSELEQDPVYRAHPRDFERFHTRYVSPERVREALRQP